MTIECPDLEATFLINSTVVKGKSNSKENLTFKKDFNPKDDHHPKENIHSKQDINDKDDHSSKENLNLKEDSNLIIEVPKLMKDTNCKEKLNLKEDPYLKKDSSHKKDPNHKEDPSLKDDPNFKENQSNHTNRWSLQEHPNKGTPVRNSPSLGSIPKHKRASKCSKDELSDLPETWDEECQKHLVDFAERYVNGVFFFIFLSQF